MVGNKLNKNWLYSHLNDPFVKLAQKNGYRSRAFYKLKEIDEQEHLIKPGQIIIDLGAAPGSWSQYIRNKLFNLKKNHICSKIISLDILAMKPIPDVFFIQGDFCKSNFLDKLQIHLNKRKVDLILSDITPNLSGVAVIDASRIEHIINLVIDFAKVHMNPVGSLLVKCFYGLSYNELIDKFRTEFKIVVLKKPKASRNKSAECFILGKVLRSFY